MVLEPGNFIHSCGHSLGKCHHLTLQEDEKGIRTPSANDLDSTVRDVGLVESHAFLIFLQGQVVTFTKGMATAMDKISWFQHQVALP